MKEIFLDVKKVVSEKISNPAITIVAIRGLNYGDVALLTKAPNEVYFWSNITASYSDTSVDNHKINFTSEYEAIFRAMIDGKTIYTFENIRDFTKWMYDSKDTTPNTA